MTDEFKEFDDAVVDFDLDTIEDDKVEVIKNVFSILDTTIKDLEDSVAKKRMTNYLVSKLLDGYPENSGVCFVPFDEIIELVEDKALKYDDDELVSDILDRLEKESKVLDQRNQEISERIDELDIISVFCEPEDSKYRVVAMDKANVEKNGIEWVVEQLKREYSNRVDAEFYDDLRKTVEGWLNE